MTKSKLFTLAHTMTKAVLQSGDDYMVTFGQCVTEIKNGFSLVVKNAVKIMSALVITAEKTTVDTVDGNSYHVTRNKINYTIFVKNDCVDVWKKNTQRGSISNDCFWNGVNNRGQKMAKFLVEVLDLINDNNMVSA